MNNDKKTKRTGKVLKLFFKSLSVREIVSFAVAFLSLSLLVGNTNAWLSTNKKAQTEGMLMKATTTPNLVIASGADELKAIDDPDSYAYIDVVFTTSRAGMKAATHDTVSDSTPAGLKYVSNLKGVDLQTGNAKSGSLVFTSVAIDADSKYYVDYDVYVGSTIATMEGISSLKVQLISPAAVTSGSATAADAAQARSMQAASIDFYVGSVSAANYRGTVNVARLNGSLTGYDTVVIESGNVNIPYNKTGDYIKIIMRCYFDGDLQVPSGYYSTDTAIANTAFITTETITTNDVSFAVKIMAE